MRLRPEGTVNRRLLHHGSDEKQNKNDSFVTLLFLKGLQAPNPCSPSLRTQPCLSCLCLPTEMNEGKEQLRFLLRLHFLAIQLYTCCTVYTALICCVIVLTRSECMLNMETVSILSQPASIYELCSARIV